MEINIGIEGFLSDEPLPQNIIDTLTDEAKLHRCLNIDGKYYWPTNIIDVLLINQESSKEEYMCTVASKSAKKEFLHTQAKMYDGMIKAARNAGADLDIEGYIEKESASCQEYYQDKIILVDGDYITSTNLIDAVKFKYNDGEFAEHKVNLNVLQNKK